MSIANQLSGFSSGIPLKDAQKNDKTSQRFYNLGVTAAALSMGKQQLAKEKQEFEISKNDLLKSIISENMKLQQQQMQVNAQAQYQGSVDGTKQHLDGYSQQLAGMLGGSQPQQSPQGGQPPQPQM